MCSSDLTGPHSGTASPPPPLRKAAPAGGRSRPAGTPPTAAASAAPARSEAAAAGGPTLEEVLALAGAMANDRRFRDAIACCEEHLRRLGPSPAIFFLLGMLHQSAGDLDRAEGCFHKTLYLDATHEDAILSLALLAAQRGDAAMEAQYRQSAARILARKAAP